MLKMYILVYTQAACINLHVQGLLERSWILWFTEKNYCVLCRMMCVLLNDYQLKGSAQKIMILIIFPKDTVFFFSLHELDLQSTTGTVPVISAII